MAIPDWVKDMPAFDPCPECLKCGYLSLSPKFHTPVTKDDWPEHLFWTCPDCGAGRYTKCKDAS